jgi:hypothetical protein
MLHLISQSTIRKGADLLVLNSVRSVPSTLSPGKLCETDLMYVEHGFVSKLACLTVLTYSYCTVRGETMACWRDGRLALIFGWACRTPL